MDFQLVQEDKLLGTLRSYDLDFPWAICKFEATEEFQKIKPIFDEELKLSESEDFEKWKEVYKQIESLNLKLISAEDERIIEEFLLHIKDDEAWFRM
ncbi:MAG TPA: hypothetical protein VGC76_12280 [Pyrinomonadaceae bacterium]